METKWAILFTECLDPCNLLVKIFPASIDFVCPGDWIVVGRKALIRTQKGVKTPFWKTETRGCIYSEQEEYKVIQEICFYNTPTL